MSIRDLVKQLGGRVAVARSMGVSQRTVSDWMTKGYISGVKAMAFYDLCHRYGIHVSMSEVTAQ